VKQVENLTSQINYKIREREIKHLREEQEMKTWKLKQQHQRDQELFDIMDYLVRKREGIEEMTDSREMKAKLSMRAFSGSYQSFFLIPTKSNKYSYPKFFDDAKSEIKRIIKLKLNELRGVKVKLSYLGLFRYGVGLDERHEAKNFHSKVRPAYPDSIETVTDDSVAEVEKDISDFIAHQSGWIFLSNIIIHINIYKFKPIKGSSFLELPGLISNTKACVNVKNNDLRCFIYCILASENLGQKHLERPSIYEKFMHKYDDWKTYPVEISDIPKFEKQYGKSINVYEYKIRKNRVSYNNLYVTPNLVNNSQDVINLLLVSKGEKHHYVLIKSLSRLLYGNYNRCHKVVVCPSCFKNCYSVEALDKHLKNGCLKFGERVEFPKNPVEHIKFKSIAKMLPKPFLIYAGFEAILEETPDFDCGKTFTYQKHLPCSYAYKVVCSVEKYNKEIVVFRAADDSVNVAEHFLNSLLKESSRIKAIMRDTIEMHLTPEQEQEFQAASHCSLCNLKFKKENEMQEMFPKLSEIELDKKIKGLRKVRDHDHLTGDYRGAAHDKCNIQYGWKNYQIPVIFHNLKGYDSHFIIKALNSKFTKINCIPSSTEKFVSFSVNNLVFLDSLGFINAKLEELVYNLSKNELDNINKKFKHFLGHFKNLTDEQKLLLIQKGVYPYDFMNSFEKFHQKSFPIIEDCFSKLNNEALPKEDHQRALKVWESFEISDMGEYHDLYLKTDVLLLADVFENFRSSCIKSYGLDPTHYYTLPGLAWDAALKMTGIKLDVFSEEQHDMHLIVERGIRGGISVVSHRYAEANNKYVENYDPKKPTKFITYLDANALYSWAMSQYLPTGDFQWIDPSFSENDILRMTNEQTTGYIFVADLEYPVELHDLHNDYPLAPEKLTVSFDELSDHSKEILNILKSKHVPIEKLIPNLHDKTNYVVHYRNLKLYLELGLKIKKIHQVISFTQSPWLKKYIDFNTRKRKEATEDFEKDLFKMMNNAVFGKTLENVRKRVVYDLVNNKKRYEKMVTHLLGC